MDSRAAYIWAKLGESATRRWSRMEQRVYTLTREGLSTENREEVINVKRKIFGVIREMNKIETAAGVPQEHQTEQWRAPMSQRFEKKAKGSRRQ